MKLLFSDFKLGEVKLEVETLDDLWHLKGIIEQGDLLSGRTLRKVSGGGKDERAKEATRKPMFLGVRVERIDYEPSSAELRVGGPMVHGPEEVPLGTHHTFSLVAHTEFSLKKSHWLKFQRDKLEQALKAAQSKVLIVVMDREEAFFALLKSYGYEVLLHLRGQVQKKGDTASSGGNFYQEILGKLTEYELRYQLERIVVASPAFWKEELAKEADEALSKKLILATCSSVGENGIAEVLKRPEVKEALKQERAAYEAQQIEELLTQIAKQGSAAYGVAEVKKAVDMGAVKFLLISDAAIAQAREQGSYPQLEWMMKSVEDSRGDILIVSVEHDAGKQLQGIGGIGALLRFKLNY